MRNYTIYSFIKTPCGRSKYESLLTKKGLFSKLRLLWFVIFAAIKDWNLKNQDELDESKS